MRAFQFVAEAKGVFGRKRGDAYTNDNGETISFIEALMYPNAKVGDAYKDHETARAAVNEIERKKGLKISWANLETPQSNAFAIAFLETKEGGLVLWGRWYKVVPTNIITSWSNKQLPTGWVFSSKTAEKAKSGMMPQDLIGTDEKFGSVDSLLQLIESKGASPEIMSGLRIAAAGETPIMFQNLGSKMTSVRDHLGEIITPIALMTGIVDDNNSKNAKSDILKTDYNKCSVYFPQGKNANLCDSFIVSPNGMELGISTKGNKGATASISNLITAINKSSPELKKTYDYTVKIMSKLNENNQYNGPLVLGVDFGIIDEYLKDEIIQHIKDRTADPLQLSDNAKKLFVKYKSKEESSGFNLGYVLLANCAKSVAEKLNNDEKFQDGCRSFLNQASIIQVYTDAKVVGADTQITGFRTVYPPKFTGTVAISAGKTYMSTGVKGKFTFDIGKGAS